MSMSTLATGAYKAAADLTKAGTAFGAEKKSSFADVLSGALGQFQQQAKASDQKAESLAAGKAVMIDVVTAVAETQIAVESMVAVRDKVIAAYDEIMKMAI
jgi:flagellar hook-basal body complex protein FliE